LCTNITKKHDGVNVVRVRWCFDLPASAGKAKAGMVHSVSGWTRGVQVKLWDPLRTRAILERLKVSSRRGPIQIYVYLYLYLFAVFFESLFNPRSPQTLYNNTFLLHNLLNVQIFCRNSIFVAETHVYTNGSSVTMEHVFGIW